MDGIRHSALEVSASGLYAERRRLDVIARNIANARTTRTAEGGPYRRQVVLFEPLLARARAQRDEVVGVRVAEVARDTSPTRSEYRPGHPDADQEGYVEMPNVSLPLEMVDMMAASRGYEANLQAARVYRQMAERALDVGR